MLEPVLPQTRSPAVLHPDSRRPPAPRAVIAQREGFPEDAVMPGSTLASHRPRSPCDNYCHRHPGGLQLGAHPQPAPMGPAKGPDSAQGCVAHSSITLTLYTCTWGASRQPLTKRLQIPLPPACVRPSLPPLCGAR